MLDKSHITLLLNNKFINNRKNEIKAHFLKDFK